MPIGGLLMGVLASSVGILEAIAVGGILSLGTGLAAFVWYRRLAPRPTEAPITEPSVATSSIAPAEAATAGRGGAIADQSGAPSTSAAFKPPKPNEVLSTRR
jgi:hypothetical protein